MALCTIVRIGLLSHNIVNKNFLNVIKFALDTVHFVLHIKIVKSKSIYCSVSGFSFVSFYSPWYKAQNFVLLF